MVRTEAGSFAMRCVKTTSSVHGPKQSTEGLRDGKGDGSFGMPVDCGGGNVEGMDEGRKSVSNEPVADCLWPEGGNESNENLGEEGGGWRRPRRRTAQQEAEGSGQWQRLFGSQGLGLGPSHLGRGKGGEV